jgi:phosphoribosylformylglycinamidine synthase subunit PurQ / glutaminase
MMMNRPKVLIPTGYGLNCEQETAFGYRRLGADADIVHINDLSESPDTIEDYHIVTFIGGFSDGDHIASGKVHANRIRYRFGKQLRRFVNDGKLVIGICNGFQALVKSGMLPALDKDYGAATMTLTYNDSGIFEDRWVHLLVNQRSNCIWTKGIRNLYLPIRHGEGKIRAANGDVIKRLEDGNQVALSYMNPSTGKVAKESEYPYNPNGSTKSIAGICDTTGRVFGMMPHWEAFISPYNHPGWTRLADQKKLPKEGLGAQIARNGIKYVKDKLL